MGLRKFVQIVDGRVGRTVVVNAEVYKDYMDITDRPDAVPNAEYDTDTDTFTAPNPDHRKLLKALVLIVKAAIQADVIPIAIVPQEAKDIWQEIKDDRL